MSETSIRVAPTRLVAAGKVSRPSRGFHAIDRTAVALLRGVDDWQHRRVRSKPWAGDWLAVHDAVVLRSDRTVWRHHSPALALRGFAPLRPSLLVRPDHLEGGLDAERR